VDFLLVLINFFSPGVTDEALQANTGINWKLVFSLQWGLFDPKFHVHSEP